MDKRLQNIKNFYKWSEYKKYKRGLTLCGVCVVELQDDTGRHADYSKYILYIIHVSYFPLQLNFVTFFFTYQQIINFWHALNI